MESSEGIVSDGAQDSSGRTYLCHGFSHRQAQLLADESEVIALIEKKSGLDLADDGRFRFG